ncbi:MAG: zinc ribbon domain-containing protein [bacterium]|nr:zinc ribbon domain-containing protein [bacterium]
MAFFEQLGKTLNEASDNLKRKTQNFSEVNSLEKQVNANQSAVQNLYVEIGRAYYEAHKGDMQGDYVEQCRMITDMLNQIAQLQDQIRIKKGIQLCPNCGAQLALGSMFCAGCGAQVAQPAPQQPAGSVAPQAPVQPMNNAAPQAPVQPADHAAPQTANTKVCGQCGSQIPADSAFCPVCGQRI